MTVERTRFRWALIWVPLTVAALAWAAKSVRPAGTWRELKEAVGIENHQRYTELAVLALALLAIVLVARFLHRREEE